MKIELNKLIYSNKNSRKYQYLTDAQEAIKIDFLLVLIDLPEIDKKVKLKFLFLQRIKKILISGDKNKKIKEFYDEIKHDKDMLYQISDLEAKYQDILRRVRKSGINDIVSLYKKNSENEKFNLKIILKKAFENKVSASLMQFYLNNNFKCLLSLTPHPTNPSSLEYTIIGNEFDKIISNKSKLNFKKLHDNLKRIILCSITSKKKTPEEEMIESELAIVNIKRAEKNLIKKWQNIIQNSPYKNKIYLPKNICNFNVWTHGGDTDGNPNITANILLIGIERIKKLHLKTKIDLRHDSSEIEDCAHNFLKIFKIEYKNLTENDKLNIIHNIIKNKQELNILKKHIKNNFSHEIIKRLIIVSNNKKYFDKFIISNHQSASQSMLVLLMLIITDNYSKNNQLINIITLSESLNDLKNIAKIWKSLIDDEIFCDYLLKTKKIIAMIAKSDTVRVAGIAVDYYQDLAAGEILILKNYFLQKYKTKIAIHIFNGGGNALQRGGGRHDEIAIRHCNALIEVASKNNISVFEIDPSLSTIQGQQQQILFSCISIAENNIENFALHNLFVAININNLSKNFKNINFNLEIRQEFSDVAIKNYQTKFFDNKYLNELFFNANHLGVALANLSSRPLKRGVASSNISAPINYNNFRGDIENFNIFNTRAITLDRTIAHTACFALMFLGLVETFEHIKKKYNYEYLNILYRNNKSFQDFIRNQILSLKMVDIDYAWKILIGIERPNIHEILELSKLFESKKIIKYSLHQRQKITMAFIDKYIFDVANNIAKSVFKQDLELNYNYYDLTKIVELYSNNLAIEMKYRQNEAIFTKHAESEIINNLNKNPNQILQEIDLKTIHNLYIANNIVFNAPLALSTISTTLKENSYEVQSFLENISDQDLYF